MSNHLETVQAIYAAFGRGDVPAILDLVADNVRWESWEDNHGQVAGVPWLTPRTDKAGVLEFFKIIGAMKISDFRVIGLMAGQDQVSAEVFIETELPNGGSYRDEEMHLWNFDSAGKVIRFRHYVDTAKHIAAAQGTRTIRKSVAA